MNKCNCTIAISLNGDGCRYCQPQEYIDRLHEQINDTEIERDTYERSFQFLLSESEMWKDLRADVLALCEIVNRNMRTISISDAVQAGETVDRIKQKLVAE